MDKKKLSTGLKIGAFVFAIITLIAFADYAIDGFGNMYFTTFQYMFNQFPSDASLVVHYNGVYITSFVLVLLAIVALGLLVFVKLTGLGAAQIGKCEKYIVIGAIACLAIVAIFAFCARAVLLGEMCANGESIEEAKEYMRVLSLGKGAICQGIFGLLGAGALGAALVIEK